MLGAACCTAGLTGWRVHVYLAQTLPKALEAVDLEVEGTIASMLQNTANGQRWRFEVDQAATGVQGVPPLIELSWYGPYGQELDASQPLQPAWSQGLTLSPGQRWRFTVRLKRPHGARNPHGFDYELLAWEQGVQAMGYVREKPAPQLLEMGSAYRLQRWRQWLRERIRGQIQQLQAWFPALESGRQQAAMGVVAALAVGDQQAIDLVIDKRSLR
jgi:competence protein ComEC